MFEKISDLLNQVVLGEDPLLELKALEFIRFDEQGIPNASIKDLNPTPSSPFPSS